MAECKPTGFVLARLSSSVANYDVCKSGISLGGVSESGARAVKEQKREIYRL